MPKRLRLLLILMDSPKTQKTQAVLMLLLYSGKIWLAKSKTQQKLNGTGRLKKVSGTNVSDFLRL